MKFPESPLAHKYLDGLNGIEIGGSAHNPFGLNTKNVDYSDDMTTVFKLAEIRLCGEALPVDIVAYGDNLPLDDNSVDFVISSHVIEHIFDPIKALGEWARVVRPGGYILTIAPITEFVPGENRPTTSFDELLKRNAGIILESEILQRIKDRAFDPGILGEDIINGILYDTKHGHWTVFDMPLFECICNYLGLPLVEKQNVDDKVGNGFTTIIKILS
ncbi:MAG TPA: methyltransferase domain-containing protein [Bacteroidales bacterium]|nr:methyltransferase domain-containing protein [Bacteroidales bacterium]HQP16235.1 methyltransferase domain-containing protein [Bacteroidales bacterium]